MQHNAAARETCNKIFHLADKDGDGYLSVEEMANLAWNPSKGPVEELIQKMLAEVKDYSSLPLLSLSIWDKDKDLGNGPGVFLTTNQLFYYYCEGEGRADGYFGDLDEDYEKLKRSAEGAVCPPPITMSDQQDLFDGVWQDNVFGNQTTVGGGRFVDYAGPVADGNVAFEGSVAVGPSPAGGTRVTMTNDDGSVHLWDALDRQTLINQMGQKLLKQ